MKIQYASDLHLEFEGNRRYLMANPIVPLGDILILAGDTQKLSATNSPLISELSEKFKSIYLIPGNHEFYGKEIPICEIFPSFKKELEPNVVYLNNQVVYLENVRIIFTTLFTRITDGLHITHALADFHLSRFDADSRLSLTVEQYNQCHDECLAFLNGELSKPFDGKTVVVTHHGPYPKSMIVHYPKFEYDMSEAFLVDLTGLTSEYQIDHWISGHTHIHFDSFKVGNTSFHSNMLGYVHWNEHQHFDPSKTIEV